MAEPVSEVPTLNRRQGDNLADELHDIHTNRAMAWAKNQGSRAADRGLLSSPTRRQLGLPVADELPEINRSTMPGSGLSGRIGNKSHTTNDDILRIMRARKSGAADEWLGDPNMPDELPKVWSGEHDWDSSEWADQRHVDEYEHHRALQKLAAYLKQFGY